MPTIDNPTIQEINLKKDGIYFIELLYCTGCYGMEDGRTPLYFPKPHIYDVFYKNKYYDNKGNLCVMQKDEVIPICPYFAPTDIKKVLCLVSKKNGKIKIIKFPKIKKIISLDKIIVIGFNTFFYRNFIDFVDFDSLKTKQHTLKGEDFDIVFNPIFLKENQLFVYLAKNIKKIHISGIDDDFHSRYGWYYSYDGWRGATYSINSILMQICIYKL